MVDFLQEVQEEWRRERWARRIKENMPLLVGFALAILIGTAAGTWYKNHQVERAKEASARYAEAQMALAGGVPEQVKQGFATLLDLKENHEGIYRTLAALEEADAYAVTGNIKEAVLRYHQLAEASDQSIVWRDMARLRAAFLLLQNQSLEQLSMEQELTELAAEERPWRHTARQLHLAYAIEQKDTDATNRLVQHILEDPTTPPEMQARVTRIQTLLGQGYEYTPFTPQEAAPAASPAVSVEDAS